MDYNINFPHLHIYLDHVEFWVALVTYLVIYAPLSYALHKRWSGIREKLAVYELATKEETWDW